MNICMENEYSLSKNTNIILKTDWQTTGHLEYLMQFKCLHKMHIMQRHICVCVCVCVCVCMCVCERLKFHY